MMIYTAGRNQVICRVIRPDEPWVICTESCHVIRELIPGQLRKNTFQTGRNAV